MARTIDKREDDIFASILDALDEMPENVRLTFVLKHYKGFSIAEIANRTGRSETETEAMLKKAKETLYSKLRPLALPEKPSLRPDARRTGGARAKQFNDLHRLLCACTSG